MTILNIKFKDENYLISLDDDIEAYDGCETCNYGSQYINYFSFNTTNYIVEVEFNQMYEFAVSVGDIIKIFAVELSKFTEKEFIEYLTERIKHLGEEKTNKWNNNNPLKKLEVKENNNEVTRKT